MIIVKTDGTKRNKFFEKICGMTQRELKRFLKKELKNRKRTVVNGDGFLFSEGDVPLLLVAHMDTVHKETPKEIIYSKGTVSSPQGIGGDDRCGIYMILQIIREINANVLFVEDEEIGGVGSGKFIKTETCKNLKGRIEFIIELDRKGSNDAVYYDCSNVEFEEFVEKEFWKYGYGSFTDICNLCPEIEVAGVNLSCGYYNAHHLDEYVVLREMEDAIKEVKKLILRRENKTYEYVECESYSSYSGLFGRLGSYGDYGRYDYCDYGYGYKKETGVEKKAERNYEIVFRTNNGEEVYFINAINEFEALGKFMVDHPDKTYDDVLEIY